MCLFGLVGPRSFEIGLPSEAGRASIVALLLSDEALDSDDNDLPRLAAYVAARTDGYSGSDLKEVRARLVVAWGEAAVAAGKRSLFFMHA